MRTAGIGAALLALVAARALAVDVERLVMPGPLSAAHADLETRCSSCHAPFDRTAQRALCLDCHKEVAEDLARHLGFHGHLARSAELDCKSCHTDHAGREADITGLHRDAFAHDGTDFPLRGAHARLVCGACHVADKPFRVAPHACTDCHAEDEPHRGRLGTKCGDCHGVDAWRSVRFDHAGTRFPLVGKHAEVSCQLCHPNERYRETPRDCVSCHRIDDVHHGTFGTDCSGCHSPRGWKERDFDHDRDTKFPLRGAHARAQCSDCHREDPRARPLATDCLSCHRADDEHRGRNGPNCERCHGTAAWTPTTFDHDRDTKFSLRGAHRAAACSDCHTQPPFAEHLRKDCYSCHKKDDVHAGRQGTDCARCHDERSWTAHVRFDHDLTHFPLLGMHAVTACGECHAGHEFSNAQRSCAGCHRDDDVHRGSLGKRCEQCHNPNGWQRWEFDHGAQTDFPLRGAHEDLACSGCHSSPVHAGAAPNRECQACHVRDDAHRGSFGRDCARCHVEEAWKPAISFR